MGGGPGPTARRPVMAVVRSPVAIRSASVDDLDRIAEIEQACFSDPWTRDALASALALPHVRFFVGELAPSAGDGERGTAGYVVALVLGDEGEIADLAVLPAARRRGVGTALLDRTEKDLAARGVRTLYLEVRESNADALALYRSRGFEPVGRRRGYYRHPPEDALVLRRDLAPT